MVDKKKKDSFMALPIENHETAAWMSGWKAIKPESNVVIPTEEAVRDAKDWVDANQIE